MTEQNERTEKLKTIVEGGVNAVRNAATDDLKGEFEILETENWCYAGERPKKFIVKHCAYSYIASHVCMDLEVKIKMINNLISRDLPRSPFFYDILCRNAHYPLERLFAYLILDFIDSSEFENHIYRGKVFYRYFLDHGDARILLILYHRLKKQTELNELNKTL